MNYIDRIAGSIFAKAHSGGKASDGDRELYRLYAVLARTKGVETTAEDVHDAWSAWMLTVHPDHRSIKPFDELTSDVQKMDEQFVNAIHETARLLLKS
jgi:hypothetical protein